MKSISIGLSRRHLPEAPASYIKAFFLLFFALAFSAFSQEPTVDLTSDPSPDQLASAKAAFRKGAVLKIHDADPIRLSGLFNLSLNPTETPVRSRAEQHEHPRYCVIGVRQKADGSLSTYLGAPVMPGVNNLTTCENGFQTWLQSEASSNFTFPPTPEGAWTSLGSATEGGTDGTNNFVREQLSFYRLNGIDKANDYYMVLKAASNQPNLKYCQLAWRCGWFSETRDLTFATDGPFQLFDHGPSNIPSTGSASFNIGGGLSGFTPSLSAGYQVTWQQSSVTTTDYSSLLTNFANWHEEFTGSSISHVPPVTSTALFTSNQGAIFQVPNGTTSFNLYTRDTAHFRDETGFNIYTDPIPINRTYQIQPPVLSVSPGSVQVAPGGRGTLQLQSVVPNSSQGLAWTASSSQSWIVIDNSSGSSNTTITYHIDPNATPGSIGYLQVDTSPAYSAPSVKSGPLKVQFTVVDKQPTSGVLIAGGATWNDPSSVDTAEIWLPSTGQITPTLGRMTVARQQHTATVLANNKVLLVGGFDLMKAANNTSEYFDPASSSFSPGPNLNVPRGNHTATRLPNGQILIAGGFDASYLATNTAELFDPNTQTFQPVGTMVTAREGHTATLLADGRVLLAGGTDHYNSINGLADAEIYDPGTRAFTRTGSLNTMRQAHSAVLLKNGQVLVTGGFYPGQDPLPTAELYTPATGEFTYTGSFAPGRRYQATVLLPDDQVLMVGGYNYAVAATLYDPETATFNGANNFMKEERDHPQELAISNTASSFDGKIMVVGGVLPDTGSTGGKAIEIYDPVATTWTQAGSLTIPRSFHTTTMFGVNNSALEAGQPQQ